MGLWVALACIVWGSMPVPDLKYLANFCGLLYMLFIIALFNMSELTKNQGRIGIPIANLIDVAAHKVDERLKWQRILGPKALSCKNL